MLRILLWIVAAYLVYRIARRLIVEIRRYFPTKPQVRSSPSSRSSGNQIDYSKVQDADYEDLKEGKDKPS